MEWIVVAIVAVLILVFVAMTWCITISLGDEQEERDYIRRMMR